MVTVVHNSLTTKVKKMNVCHRHTGERGEFQNIDTEKSVGSG